MFRETNRKHKSNVEVGGTLTGNRPKREFRMIPLCKLIEGLVGPRSASRVFFSHGVGGLGWLRGWLVPVLRRGCFLATVLVV